MRTVCSGEAASVPTSWTAPSSERSHSDYTCMLIESASETEGVVQV